MRSNELFVVRATHISIQTPLVDTASADGSNCCRNRAFIIRASDRNGLQSSVECATTGLVRRNSIYWPGSFALHSVVRHLFRLVPLLGLRSRDVSRVLMPREPFDVDVILEGILWRYVG